MAIRIILGLFVFLPIVWPFVAIGFFLQAAITGVQFGRKLFSLAADRAAGIHADTVAVDTSGKGE